MCSTKCLSTSLTVEFSSVQSKHIHALLPFANQSFRVFSIVGTTALHNCSGTEFFLATKQRIIVSVCLISATAWPGSSAWLVARVLVWPVLFARSCLSLLHSSVVCISHSIIIQPALVFVLFPHQSSFSLQLHTPTAPRICFWLGTRNCGYTFLSWKGSFEKFNKLQPRSRSVHVFRPRDN